MNFFANKNEMLGEIQVLFYGILSERETSSTPERKSTRISSVSTQDMLKKSAEIGKKKRDNLVAMENSWVNNYKSVFNAAIDTVFQEVKKELEINKWLIDDEEFKNKLLIKILKNNFVNKDTITSYIDNKDNKTEQIISDQNNILHTLPLLDLSLYREPRTLPTCLSDPFTLVPTRFDIYRLLLNEYEENIKTVELSGGRYCAKVVPMNLSELEKLSEAERDYLKTIIVNINPDDSKPNWVILNKNTGGNWDCYYSHFNQDIIGILSIRNFIITPQNVDFSKNFNKDYKDYKDYKDDIVWHAVLFSRVLPYCIDNRNGPIENYRSQLPISLLLQNTIEESVFDAPVKEKISRSFSYSKPMSLLSENEIYNNRNQDTKYLFLQNKINNISASAVLQDILNGKIKISKDYLTISDKDCFSKGMQLTYFNDTKELNLDYQFSTGEMQRNIEWFDYNLSLRNIYINSKNDEKTEDYISIKSLAARNRFLAQVNPNYLQDHRSDEIDARQNAWKNTGKCICDVLTYELDNNVQTRKTIAEMGTKGLDNLFDYLNTNNNEGRFTFHLDSSATISPDLYINHLSSKIKNISTIKTLDFILPEAHSLNDATIDAFVRLISSVNDKEQELTSIKLFNVNFTDENSLQLLEKLADSAKKPEQKIQIIIPDLDEKVAAADERDVKSKYRELQNIINNNIREKRASEQLSLQKTSLKEERKVTFPLRSGQSVDVEQEGFANDKTYSLKSKAAGVQQQAQQEAQQQAQQEAERKPQVVPPVVREILPYTGSYDALINRENSVEKGITDFSALVGSNKDAKYIIKYIDEAAAEKIKKYQCSFKFGIDWENAAGFRVWYGENDVRILTFNADIEKQDLKDLANYAYAHRLDKVSPRQNFIGDYRQLAKIAGKEDDDLVIAWKMLAVEDLSAAVKICVNQDATSESMQYLDNTKNKFSNIPENYLTAMQKIFKDWYSSQDENNFLNILFNDFNEENTKSFGQLFYHYGAEGTDSWLKLCKKIQETYGDDKLKTFKKIFLDSLENFSEILDVDEIDTLTNSMAKLKSHPDHKEILWSLITKHAGSVLLDKGTRIRFSEIWRSYDDVITFIDSNDLAINKTAFIEVLGKNSDKFNAMHFLRRLRFVLYNASNRQDSKEIQQQILANLAEIDWTESGFYYACKFENYKYWDADLQFSELNNFRDTEASYQTKWDEDNSNITNNFAFTLRYAALRLKLNHNDFQKFKELINSDKIKGNLQVLRLVTASLALGRDSLDNINRELIENLCDTKYDKLIKKINDNLKLDTKDLISHSYHLNLSDLPELFEAINTVDPNLELNYDRHAINALGRAMSCYNEFYSESKTEKLKALIQYAKGNKNGFNSHLVSSLPWEIESKDNYNEDENLNDQQIRFFEQLSTIEFKKGGFLPPIADLNSRINKINDKETRLTVIKELVSKNCNIKDQDAEYRSLQREEKGKITDILLLKTFSEQNRKSLDKLLAKLAIKDSGNCEHSLKELKNLFEDLDKKSYYDELGYVLGLLVGDSRLESKSYSIEQLTNLLKAVFDPRTFQVKHYPLSLVKIILEDALADEESSLLNKDLTKLTEPDEHSNQINEFLTKINLSSLPYSAKKSLTLIVCKNKKDPKLAEIYNLYFDIFSNIKDSRAVVDELCNLIKKNIASVNDDKFKTRLQNLSSKNVDNDFKNLWEQNQLKIIKLLLINRTGTDDKEFSEEDKISLIDEILKINDPHIKMIVIAAVKEKKDQIDLVKKIVPLLERIQKEKLAKYYKNEPYPDLETLDNLLRGENNTPPSSDELVNNIIFKFETKHQKYERKYSLTSQDKERISIVLKGCKLKHDSKSISKKEQVKILNLLYYINNYSQQLQLENMPDDKLQELILKKNRPSDKAELLACMRGMLYGKTGMWANHTQMINLLYGALHNDESLMHQVRTGEGKSIITFMRVAYRALNGQVVDVFSSKESLSKRDFEEFSHVYSAFGIENSFIKANSKPNEYKHTVDDNGVGAVNFSTIGNFSLFISGSRWKEGNTAIKLDADNRFAFLDEGDHLMRYEDTLFNFSDTVGGASTTYNYDAWVYTVVFEYYSLNKDEWEKNDFNIKENPGVSQLYEKLRDSAQKIAPQQSRFFENLSKENKEHRIIKLLGLLKAAHKADNLEQDKNYCIMAETKEIAGESVDIRTAKVMIDSQIYPGSTYSDSVQQFLHTKLNLEAIGKNESANFFIEPESEIVLSFNARHILKNWYKGGLETCTGTPGDPDDLKYYSQHFNINNVIKIPTNLEIRTKYLEPTYIEVNKEEALDIQATTLDIQANKIIEAISNEYARPVLIACEDDKEVEILGKILKKKLTLRDITIDLNADGIPESEIVKDAGKNGRIIISSRMGRGTNIKPYDTNIGLHLIRTYPTDPAIEKQENGRQGRNNAYGICQNIINYNKVLEKYNSFKNITEFTDRLKVETEHLESKLSKHSNLNFQNKKNWEEISKNEELKDKYLKTRTVVWYERYLRDKSKEFTHKKDDLIAIASNIVMNKIANIDINKWTNVLSELENIFAEDITDDEKYNQAKYKLEFFFKDNGSANIFKRDLENLEKLKEKEINKDLEEDLEDALIEKRIDLYQKWLVSSEPRFDNKSVDSEDIKNLFLEFEKLDKDKIDLINSLLTTYKDKCVNISYNTWYEGINALNDEDNNDPNEYKPRIEQFFKNNGIDYSFEKKFIETCKGAPDRSCIVEVVNEYRINLDREKIEEFAKESVKLFRYSMNKADRRFCLKNIAQSKSISDDIAYINEICKNRNLLKSEDAKKNIRPIFAMLGLKKRELINVVLGNGEFDKLSAWQLSFLSNRPDISESDVKSLQNKLDDISDNTKKIEFLEQINNIPPNIPVSKILAELVDLPGMYTSKEELQEQIQEIKNSAQAFNNFLFLIRIIPEKNSLCTDSNNLFKWVNVFDKLNLSESELLYSELSKYISLNEYKLLEISEQYIKDKDYGHLQSNLNQVVTPKVDSKENNKDTSSFRLFRGS